MSKRRWMLPVFLWMLAMPALHAQKVALSTNVVEYANLATLNAEASYAWKQHWSAFAAVKYNPFSFEWGEDRHQVNNRQQTYGAGVRYWPWHVYSGWWISSRAQYQEYNVGGLVSEETREGDRIGAGFGAGYTYMLHKRFNLEFGLGFWAGADRYRVYDCPVCGITQESGSTLFLLPSDVIIALSYVF